MKYLTFKIRYFILLKYFGFTLFRKKSEQKKLTIGGLQRNEQLLFIKKRYKKIAYQILKEIPIRYALPIALSFETKADSFITLIGMKQLTDRIGKQPIVIASSHIGAYSGVFPILLEYAPLNVVLFKDVAKESETLLLKLKKLDLPVKVENMNFIKIPSISGMKTLLNSFLKKEIIFFLIDSDVGIRSKNGISFDFLSDSLLLPDSMLKLIIKYNAYFMFLTVENKVNNNFFKHYFQFKFNPINYTDKSNLLEAYQRLLKETEHQIIEKPERWTLWMYQSPHESK